MSLVKRLQYYIDEAKKEAYKSVMTHKHGAVVIDTKGRIVGRGYNYVLPKQYRGHWSMHAERDAIRDCFKNGHCSIGATIVIIRVSIIFNYPF